MKTPRRFPIPLFFKTYLASFSGLPKTAWQGIFLSGIESILVSVINFLMLYFVQQLKFTTVEAGALISFYGVGTILGAWMGGKLSDKCSPSKISIYALLLQSIAYFMLIYNKNFYCLILNLFLMGVGGYGFITSNTLWVLGFCEEQSKRLKALNLLSVTSNLGLSMAALIISFFMLHDFTYLFFLSSISLALIAAYIKKLNTNIPIPKKIPEEILKKESYSTRQTIIIFYTLFCVFIIGMMVAQTNSTYPLYLTYVFPDMGVKSFSILFAINTLLVVFFQTILVDTFNHYNKVFLLGVSVFLFGFSFLVLRFSSLFFTAILSVIIMTIGEILFFSIAQFICYEKSEKNKKGQSLGTYRMIYAGSRIAGPFIGGTVFQYLGSEMLWYLCFIFGLICSIPASLLGKKFNFQGI